MGYVVRKVLYLIGYFYNWIVIGDLEDLQVVILDDVCEFYNQFYMFVNVILVIVGDIDIV